MNIFKKTAAGGVLVAACALLAPLAFAPAATAATPLESPVQVAFGDSLTRAAAVGGKNSTGGPINDVTGSWSTGTDSRVESHRMRLQALSKKTVTAYNYSVGGSVAADLVTQAAKTPANATYATILTGGNDICRATSLDKLPSAAAYKVRISAGIAEVKKRAPEARILLGSVPNLKRLYEVGQTDSTAILYHGSNRICPIALGTFSGETAAQAQERRNIVDAKVREFNQTLSTIAAETPGVTWDKGAIYNTKFEIADLSTADYFHPSYSGQRKVAEGTWAAVLASGMLGGNSTPAPTATPKPTASATPTATPKPTASVTPTATPKPTASPTATPKPTASATPKPTTPAADAKVTLLSSSKVTGASTKLAVSVESGVPVTSIKASVEGLRSTVSLVKSSKDGNYYSNPISTKQWPADTYDVTFTVRLSGGKVVTSVHPITVVK